MRQTTENVVEKNLAHISSNTRIINESKRLAFKWRWQAMANCVKNKLPEQFDFIKQSSVWQRLFYITANYGTNENMRRRHRLKKINGPVVSFNRFSELEGYFI